MTQQLTVTMGRRRLVWAAAALSLAVILGGLGSLRWPAPPSLLVSVAETLALPGIDLRLVPAADVSPTIRLLPWPELGVPAASLERRDSTSLGTAEDVAIRISPARLLLGQRPVRAVTIGRLALDETALNRYDFSPLALARGLAGSFGNQPLRLAIGSLTAPSGSRWAGAEARVLLDKSAGRSIVFEAAGQSERLFGPFALTISLSGSPDAVRRPLDFQWRAAGGSLSVQGHALGGGALAIEGRTNATLDRETVRRLGAPDGLNLAGPLTVAGHLRLTPEGANLTNARFEGFGDGVTGAIDLRFDGPRPRAHLTLDAQTLRLGNEDDAPIPLDLFSAGHTWDDTPFSGGHWPVFDIDARMSARQLRLANQTILRPVLSAIVQAGRLELALLNGQWHRGQTRLRLAATAQPDGSLETRLTGSLDRFDSEALLVSIGSPRRLSGTMSAQIAVSSRGASVAALAAALEGRINLAAGSGELIGVDLERTLLRAAPRLPLPPLDLVQGRTPFESAQLQVRWSAGRGTLAETGIRGPGVRATLAGEIDLARQDLDLRATVSGIPPRVPAQEFAIDISGPFIGPMVTPSRLGLLRRASVP